MKGIGATNPRAARSVPAGVYQRDQQRRHTRAAEIGQPQRQEVPAPDCQRRRPPIERDGADDQPGVQQEIQGGKQQQRHDEAADRLRRVHEWRRRR